MADSSNNQAPTHVPNKLEASSLLESLIQLYDDGSTWIFLTVGLHNGDVFIIASFIEHFLAYQTEDRKVVLIADSPGKLLVLKNFIFSRVTTKLIEQLRHVNQQAIADWCQQTGRDGFGLGALNRLHPIGLSGGLFSMAPIVYSGGRFNLAEIFKSVLRIPLGSAPWPFRLSALSSLAADDPTMHLIRPGRTLIIFPYAQTVRFDARALLASVAKRFREGGFEVLTAVHGDEVPLDNTVPIRLTFDVIPTICAHAGYVVSVRSGIADLISPLAISKVVIYPDHNFARHETPSSYGFGDCSCAFVPTASHEQEDACKVFSLMSAEMYCDPRNFMPVPIAEYLAIVGEDRPLIEFKSGNGVALGRYTIFSGGVQGEGWHALEDWGVWSIGFRGILFLRRPAHLETVGRASLRLRLICPARAGYSVSTVLIDVNGAVATFEVPTHTTEITISLPTRLQTAELFRILLDVDDPVRPHSHESRFLGVGLLSAAFESDGTEE